MKGMVIAQDDETGEFVTTVRTDLFIQRGEQWNLCGDVVTVVSVGDSLVFEPGNIYLVVRVRRDRGVQGL